MRVAIIGAGALGGVIGFALVEMAEVVLVDAWAEHVAVINANGLSCERNGVATTRLVRAVSDPRAAHPAEVALVLVKASQTPWAAEACQQALTPTGVAYTLQNGLGNLEVLASVLGAGRVGQGVTALGGTLLGPGRVRHAGTGPTSLSTAPDPQRAAALAALLMASDLPTTVSANVEALVWGKLVVNVGLNALTALLRVPNGVLAVTPAARVLVALAVDEAVAVAAARGVTLPYADPVAHVLAIAAATGANRSSMLQDTLRGTATEIATINGALVREGVRLGVPTPFNATLTALVEVLEATAGQRLALERLSSL